MTMTVSEIARLVQGSVEGDGQSVITGVAGIKEAKSGDLTFLINSRYAGFLETTRAAAVIIPADSPGPCRIPSVRVKDPALAFARVAEMFMPATHSPEAGVHHTAVLGKNVTLGRGVSIGAYSVIEEGATIGDGTIIYPGVYIGHRSALGSQCMIYPQVVIREEITIGNRVILHSGAVVGSDGFGYATVDGVHHKIPQIGAVTIEDDVEIGANVTIDRARFDKTIIHKGTKIDNLVQIAHNVVIGDNTIIAAQAGIAGSTTVGKNVQIAGQVGIVGHIEIGDNVTLAAQSGVPKGIPDPGVYSGAPAKPHHQSKREWIAIKRLPALAGEVKQLQDEIEKLKERLKNLEKVTEDY